MQRKWIRARALRNHGTDGERRLWRGLRHEQLGGHKFRRQYPLAGYIVDFVCIPARLVVELDGGQHLDALAYDERRTETLRREGYRVLRFWNDDVLLRTDDVVAEIFRVLGWGHAFRYSRSRTPCPSFRPRRSKCVSMRHSGLSAYAPGAMALRQPGAASITSSMCSA